MAKAVCFSNSTHDLWLHAGRYHTELPDRQTLILHHHSVASFSPLTLLRDNVAPFVVCICICICISRLSASCVRTTSLSPQHLSLVTPSSSKDQKRLVGHVLHEAEEKDEEDEQARMIFNQSGVYASNIGGQHHWSLGYHTRS